MELRIDHRPREPRNLNTLARRAREIRPRSQQTDTNIGNLTPATWPVELDFISN
jgi:hypothetical protein